MALIEFLNKYIIGALLQPLLIVCGICFCFKLGFFHFRHPLRLLGVALGRGQGKTKRRGSSPSPAASLCMALAGTLGTGNIAGVALAIIGGGAGAVFWMWVSAAAAMAVKYAEITLALDSRVTLPSGERVGGAMYYIRGKSRPSRIAAAAFAVFCLVETVTVGSGIQANVTSEASASLLGIPGWVIGAILALLCSAVIFGGAKKISSVSSIIVPIMAVGYIALSLVSLFANREAIPSAFSAIFEGALSPRAAAGGILGYLLSPALRFGASRGLLSNEAGCGTAPSAHAASAEEDPARQGVLGIIEVFVDTILLCTLTALVILTSGVELSGGGVALTVRAYAVTFGDAAAPIITAMIFVFAWATMLCQAFYGSVCLSYLGLGPRADVAFKLLFCLSALLFSTVSSNAVWSLADLLIGLMTLINVAALLRHSNRVRTLSLPLISHLSGKEKK